MSTDASEGTVAEPSDDAVVAPLPTIGLGSVGEGGSGSAVDGDAVDSITMIGDSITVASEQAIAQQFAQIGFDDVTIVAQGGKRMAETAGDNTSGVRIASFLASEGDGAPAETLWIVALGTNDIGQYSDAAEVQSAVDSIIDAVPAASPLIWIDTYFEDEPEATAEMNAAITRAVSERGNATVAPWSAFAAAEGVLSDDGVHPTEQGVLTFAGVVTSASADFLGR